MDKTELANYLYDALELKYKSEITTAKATLFIYFNNSVAIGEHPQQLEEMDKLMGDISDAEDKLENLAKHFSRYAREQVCN
jgi:hypothetical protein